ncbi:hypothetical protein BG015_004931 [Linnemannia schmuckeri]|uniref:CENP-T/Histone H4 histone fold domain-containing protein n=1 Tax=Linnemannia schmuckeri TaxID=64567 RepID=A0A9P5S3L6_9FUNG|nr:hypothetical protein BG015_004931 [Linnemannia schmuckeri]
MSRGNPRKGLRRPDYGLLQQRDFQRLSTTQYGGMFSTQRTNTIESHGSNSGRQQNLADERMHADLENNPFLVTRPFVQGRPTPRTTTTKNGLRRPDYGPMESHVLRKQSTTTHVVSRRTLVDESLIEAMMHTNLRVPGTGSTSATAATHRNDDVLNNQRAAVEAPKEPSIWDDNLFPATDNSEFANPPQTPRRESRTFSMAPESGRRTPRRRRSRSSNQHLRTTPIKALADANEARVNRLIMEANKRGRVGRDKHSPMGILRQLSRIPGFNPAPKPSPDREPLPGSANWRKLTPKSTRTKHIDMSGSIDNPFKSLSINKDSYKDTETASRSADRTGMSSAKRRAMDRFMDDNPFLTLEDYNRMWEEEVDMARNQLVKSRESFGLPFSGGDGELLMGDDDTKDLSLAAQDLTDQFFAQTQREREQGAMDIGDITGHSGKGFDDPKARDLANDQIQGGPDQLQGAQRGMDASGTVISRYSGVLRPTDPSDALGSELRGSKYGAEDPSGKKLSELMSSDSVRATGEGVQGQDKDMEVDMNDGWEDIPDDELTQDFLSQLESHAMVSQDPASSVIDEDGRGRAAEDRALSADYVDAADVAETMDKEERELAGIGNDDQDMVTVNVDEQEADFGRLDDRTQDVDGQLDADRSLRDLDEQSKDIDEQLGDAGGSPQDVGEQNKGIDEQLDDADATRQLDDVGGQNPDVDEQPDDTEERHRDDEEQNPDVNEQLNLDEHLDEADGRKLDVDEQLDFDEQLDEADRQKPDVDKQLNDVDEQHKDIDGQNQDITTAAGDQKDPLFINDDREDIAPQNDIEYEDGYMNVNEEDHIEQQEHEEQHGNAGVQYFDDFPSELGIMSNGNILPTTAAKTRKVVRRSRSGIAVPSMPTSLQKQLVHTFSRSRMSREAMDVILEGSHLFFEQASNDLAAYANHAGRRTVDETDVELLMKRLRIIHEKVSMESLLQRYLPRELRDKVLFPDDMPSARRR